MRVHAANGYLIDEFLRDSTNHYTDAYVGPVENRVRLLRDVVQAMADTVGTDRTGVRLSPNGAIQGCNDSDPTTLFLAAAAVLQDAGIALPEMREPGEGGKFGTPDHAPIAPTMRRASTEPMVLNSDYDPACASAALADGTADAIVFGRPFIANPDLPRRIAVGVPLAEDVART